MQINVTLSRITISKKNINVTANTTLMGMTVRNALHSTTTDHGLLRPSLKLMNAYVF